MLNALVIVWRESLEAMLVIGVLLAWIARQPEPAILKRGLWGGAAAGVALAVAREGAETVVFLYGLGLENAGGTLAGLLGAALAGFLLAVATSWLVARGARYLNYRTLFCVSEILLLLIANALLANGIDRMIAMEWLPPLLDPAWDASSLLGDGQGLGRFLARPAGMLLVASLAFWSFALWRLYRSSTAAIR